MTKNELRRIYLEKRRSLSLHEHESLNQQLSSRFFSSIDLSLIQTIHTFLPIQNNKEPDTWIIINNIQSRYSRIRISVPRLNEVSGTLDNILYESPEQLRTNKWGIPQPQTGSSVPIQEIDMALVPMLIFDKHGQRVGYGKGYYDKFLSLCRKNCQRIGISLFEPVEKIEDINEFDVPLNYCITPSDFYRF